MLIKTNKVRDYFALFIRCNSNTEAFFVLAVTLSSHHVPLLGELVTVHPFSMCSSPAGGCVWTTAGLLLASQQGLPKRPLEKGAAGAELLVGCVVMLSHRVSIMGCWNAWQDCSSKPI